MRHGKKFNHLGRTADHRNAMLANMAISLIMHKRITTTLAKAKALKKYVEPLITRSKDDSTNSRRVVFSYLQNKEALKELFGVVGPKVGDRPGGYTRVIKLGHRQGDAADIAFIELVDFDENMAKEQKAAKKTRRSRKAARRQKLLKLPLQKRLRPRHPLKKHKAESAFTIIKGTDWNSSQCFFLCADAIRHKVKSVVSQCRDAACRVTGVGKHA